MQAAREIHMATVRQVLRYLKGNHGLGIILQSDSDLQIVAFSDSDWGVCPLTRKSLTSYFVTLGGSPIS